MARRSRRRCSSRSTSGSGVHQQSEGYTDHARWDFAATQPDRYPLLLHFPYFDLYRKQVVKQADLVLAMHLRGDVFTRRAEGAELRLLRAAHRRGTPRCRRARRR